MSQYILRPKSGMRPAIKTEILNRIHHRPRPATDDAEPPTRRNPLVTECLVARMNES